MKLSPGLTHLYNRKETFSNDNIDALKDLLVLKPLSMSDIPEGADARLTFCNDNFIAIAACTGVFERVATESANLQHSIQYIARYSSFLDTIIPFRNHRIPESATQKRDVLNSLRSLFTESLLNDDMITSRIISVANGTFPELENFREFLQPFGEYVSSVNMAVALDSSSNNAYLANPSALTPGSIISLVTSASRYTVLNKQCTLINEVRHCKDKYSYIETDSGTLCWSLSRSFIDLPVRLLDRAGFRPANELSIIQSKIESLTKMYMDKKSLIGSDYLVEWSCILYNCFLLIVDIMRIYTEIMVATYDCIWEFFFHQLDELEKAEEVEVLESVIVMCQQNLFKE